MTGQLHPGDQLPTESLLCQQFGVSRTTLREAVQMLRTTGLLEVTPGRGSFVKVPDIKHLVSEMAMVGRHCPNMAIEAVGMQQLIMRDVLPRLSKTQAQQRKAVYDFLLNRLSSPEENAAQESRWFLALSSLAGNALEHIMLETLLSLNESQRTARYRNPDEVLRTVHIQMRTNAAIVDGDFALAERVLTQYLTSTPVAQPVAAAA
jgi:DNA-binding FadR family transcriptional regulator